jgi:hypothetical protein
MSLTKIVEANGYLQNYYRADEGSLKFADRHEEAGSDKKIRLKYDLWRIEQLLNAEDKAIFHHEAKAEGEAKGKVEGKAEGKMETALAAFRSMESDLEYSGVVETLKKWKIPKETVKSAWNMVKAERDRPKAEKTPRVGKRSGKNRDKG